MGYSSKTFLFLCLVGLALAHVSLAENSDVQDFLNAHNAARAEVGVGPISWNKTLAAYAQNYGNQRRDCVLEHSMGPYSENICSGWSGFTVLEAVKMFVDEKQFYDYKSNKCVKDEECRHYTQVVWRDTTSLGCAKVRCHSGGIFVTCNYFPPGNNDGERPY
ncbi:basic form of pathogenesis-related protein 1-like [Juglans microcarpa x Juglans regia]|uniref:basic form of pathogenesis-related protein 1-like n=1 Tax=Juglans microcarpa x Juglans regia TaxID=2249226 RepID=UPI001B7EB576|nr:basic form of pathogenesis-related protein 1-like [Juglans microcarpa x Juglans regia]